MIQMNKLLTTITLLCFSVAVNAQQPNWVSLTDTFIEAFDEDNPEVSKQIYLYQRCAAQQLSLATLLEEANTNLAETYDRTAASLAQAAAITRIMLATERTQSQQDTEAISTSVLETITLLLEQYKAWLNHSYLLNGSYFENNPDFQLEMEICQYAAQLAMTVAD